ncbi:hypothetical protein HRR79_001235 [Exophiala dermatitidis]|nr:hypothetical protein HRR79_001235 [Exophiala dermatitidis]
MTWLKGVFACCTSHDRQGEADSRHSRIVAITGPNRCDNRPRPTSHCYYDYRDSSPPPAYNEIEQEQARLAPSDEKHSIQVCTAALSDSGNETETARPESPDSSIVSVPSTRLTGLTALQTGETTSTRGSPERTFTRGESRPPSYYSTLTRSSICNTQTGYESVEGAREGNGVWDHPVMRSDWLDTLRYHARTSEGPLVPRRGTGAGEARRRPEAG